MDFEINRKIVTIILNSISKNEKLVSYLINTLNISRESAYRRIRGDIPFTVHELIKLGSDLNFSIDEVLEREKQNLMFYDYKKAEKNSSDFFVSMLKKYSEQLEKIGLSNNLNVVMTFNSFSAPFLVYFPELFKFSYYKWFNINKGVSRNESFTDMILPDTALYYQKKMKGRLFQGNNTDIILDSNIFLNLYEDINYFYNKKLLTNEELYLIKEDAKCMIEHFEEITRTGIHESTRIDIYLSSLSISTNAIYYNYENSIETLFWLNAINPVVFQNAELVLIQMKWLSSLKLQSVLITQSNEIMQSDFIYKQNKYIEKYLSGEMQ